MSPERVHPKLRVLILDDEVAHRTLIEGRLRGITEWEVETFSAQDGPEAFAVLKDNLIDLAFVDYTLPGDDGLKVLERIRQMHPKVSVILMSDPGRDRVAVDAMKKGALDCLLRSEMATADIRQILRRSVDMQQLQNENAELRQVNRVKDEFVATASHELRTPLAVIIGYAKAMEEEEFGSLNEPQKKALRAIRVRGQQLLQMVNRLLTFKETTQGVQQLLLRPVDLCLLMKNYLDTHWEEAAQEGRKVTLERRIPADAIWVLADPQQFRDVLHSVLTNAAKFSAESGKVTISIDVREGHEAWISIQDRGRGIPPESLPHLFEGFYHTDKALTREIPGLGLGLALAKSIVAMHGGRIWLESEGQDKGSTAFVALPMVEPDTPQILVEQPKRVDKKRVLIVEDDANTVEVIRLFLAGVSENLTIHTVREGERALEMVQEGSYDLIVLDIKLQNMTGLEFIERVKKLPRERRAPTLVITGYQEAARRAVSKGADDFLIKPFDRKVFLHKALKLLGLERRSALRS